MIIKYNTEINNTAITQNLKRIINQIYKLLPNREEAVDWKLPLATILEELGGMSRLLENKQVTFFSLMCKLEGLFLLTEEKDFFMFRRTVFECLNLVQELINYVDQQYEKKN